MPAEGRLWPSDDNDDDGGIGDSEFASTNFGNLLGILLHGRLYLSILTTRPLMISHKKH